MPKLTDDELQEWLAYVAASFESEYWQYTVATTQCSDRACEAARYRSRAVACRRAMQAVEQAAAMLEEGDG
jgi:hypothetical protein